MSLLRRYAWVLGALGALGVIAFFSLWILGGGTGRSTQILGGISGLLLMAYAALDSERLSAGSRSRSFRQGSGAVGLVALATVAAGLCYALALRYDQPWDLTREGRFSLSSQTRSVLASVDEPVTVYAFFPRGSPEERAFRERMHSFRAHQPLLDVRILDPLRNPMLAEQFAITRERGTVVLEAGEDRQRLEVEFSESALASALVRLQSGVSHRVCWSEGHGEADPEDGSSPLGLGTLGVKLQDLNYEIQPQRIFTEGIDAGCDLLVIADPRTDLQVHEREALAAFLGTGGRVLLLLEPDQAPELAAELARYGLVAGDDVVLEADPTRLVAPQDPSWLLFYPEDYALHPVMRGLEALISLRVTRSVQPLQPPIPGLVAHKLLSSGPESWAESNFRDPQEPVAPDPGVDEPGPLAVASTVQIEDPSALELPRPEDPRGPEHRLLPDTIEPRPGGRLVVMGDADPATNQLIAMGNNADLLLNAIAWLADEEAQLGERADETSDQLLQLSLFDEALLWLVCLALVPGAALVTAAAVVLRRRAG